jgi:recombination protein RecA
MWTPEKKKVLDTALQQIEKQFGKGSIMKMGDKTQEMIPVTSSGNISLDVALGIGGYPQGRIIEIFGPESSGKTTLTLHAIAEVQKVGGIAAFIDAEHALDMNYARKLGVMVDDLMLSQPDNGEQALEITEILIRSGAVNMIVVDSVAALVPKAEIDGEMGDSHMALQARLMSQALRKITALCSKSDCVVVFINQLRQKIGVIFGNPEVTTGGNALKFYSSMRLDIRRITSIKQGEDIVGNRVRIKVIKNKMAPPFGSTEVDVLFNKGISHLGSVIDLAVSNKIIEKSGSWFAYHKEKIGQGRENVKLFLQNNPKILNEIENEIYEKKQLHHLIKKKPSKPSSNDRKEDKEVANNNEGANGKMKVAEKTGEDDNVSTAPAT